MDPAARHYDFCQNKECEFFPCHKGVAPADFSCLFCYCPLYALGDRCGGNFTYTAEGIKDCGHCLIPHRRENYDRILKKMGAVLELARKKPKEEQIMHAYEVFVETINPCGGENHSRKELIEVEAESPEAYVKENAPYPVMDRTANANGDTVIITGDGKGSMVRYTFTK